MNGNTNILARMRRRKTGGAFYAIALLLAAQLSAALTPCFALDADASRAAEEATVGAGMVPPADAALAAEPAHADHAHPPHHHGGVSAETSRGSHGGGASTVPPAGYSVAEQRATELDTGPHCPHCPDGFAGLDGQSAACATVDVVDTAPQGALEHSFKPPCWMASAAPVPLVSRGAARASPLREPPPVLNAVPFNIRHCVFLI